MSDSTWRSDAKFDEGPPAHLVLADGKAFPGRAFGSLNPSVGEVVFTTGLTGYEEVLTDPSYAGQIVTMTAVQMGNVGITQDDTEAADGKPRVAGFVVRELSPVVSNWRARESLGTFLERHGIMGIQGVDTRALTRHLRDHGAQNGAIGTDSPERLRERARSAPSMAGLDLVRTVTPREPYGWSEGRGVWAPPKSVVAAGRRHRVAVVDFGVKRNILRSLYDVGCDLTVFPATTPAAEILATRPEGVFLSNGPGDPAVLDYAIRTTRELLGKVPLFGICLGHQILALALGGKTYKLKFGHRGCNQPVKDLTTGRVEITTQNHGFCVDLASLPPGVEQTHVHLNDGTSEGLRVPSAKAFSVQYHPEAAAGPHDSFYLFDRFVASMGGSASTVAG
jgi:carbamoyl-phosphate synthase small subunit